MTNVQGLMAVASAVAGTGLFESVATWPDARNKLTPRAELSIAGWRTTDASGGGEGEERIREVRFNLVIIARRGEGADLHELADAAELAIQGKALAKPNADGSPTSPTADRTLPALTRLEEGRFESTTNSPEHRVTLTGRFAISVF